MFEIAEALLELLCVVVLFPFMVLILDDRKLVQCGTNPLQKSPRPPLPGKDK